MHPVRGRSWQGSYADLLPLPDLMLGLGQDTHVQAERVRLGVADPDPSYFWGTLQLSLRQSGPQWFCPCVVGGGVQFYTFDYLFDRFWKGFFCSLSGLKLMCPLHFSARLRRAVLHPLWWRRNPRCTWPAHFQWSLAHGTSWPEVANAERNPQCAIFWRCRVSVAVWQAHVENLAERFKFSVEGSS